MTGALRTTPTIALPSPGAMSFLPNWTARVSDRGVLELRLPMLSVKQAPTATIVCNGSLVREYTLRSDYHAVPAAYSCVDYAVAALAEKVLADGI